MIKVIVQLKESSQPLEYTALNTYTKGPFFCIYNDKKVDKIPLENIWRIIEDYGYSTSKDEWLVESKDRK